MLKWAIVGTGLVSLYFWKMSKGDSWAGWNNELTKSLFGDDEYEEDC